MTKLTPAQAERKLAALERKYSSPTEKYIAEFNKDKADIEALVNSKAIDQAHAYYLFEAAVTKRDKAAGDIKDKRLKLEEEAKACEPDTRSWFQRTFALC